MYGPREQSIVGRRRGPWMCEAEQIAIRPAVARRIRRELDGELVRRPCVEPRADCLAHSATPATEVLGVVDEAHQLRRGPAHERQCRVRCTPRGLVTALRGDREGKDGRI